MDSNLPKCSQPISEEEDEDCSGDEERSDGRRRRFCIERKQQSIPSGSKPKRARTDTLNRPKQDYNRASNGRRKVCDDYKRQQRKIAPRAINKPPHPPPRPTQPRPPQPPKQVSEALKGPVIFINPKFIKKFIEKSLKLTSSSSNKLTNSSQSSQSNADGSSATTTTTSATSMIDDIDFKTSSKESLQAASTMAIFRLVTECIEDDSKRDDNFNKILVSRLIKNLMQLGLPKQEPTIEDGTETINLHDQNTSTSYNSEISNDGHEGDEVEHDGGRPIPVIGGSVNQYFNKNVNNTYYFDPSKRNHSGQHHRRNSSDRNNVRHSEVQKNKLRNYS